SSPARTAKRPALASPRVHHPMPRHPPAGPIPTLRKQTAAAIHRSRPVIVVLLLIPLQRSHHKPAHYHRPHSAAPRHPNPPHRPIPQIHHRCRHHKPHRHSSQNPSHPPHNCHTHSQSPAQLQEQKCVAYWSTFEKVTVC